MSQDPTLDATRDVEQLVTVALKKLGLDPHQASNVRACLSKAYGFGYDACQADAMNGMFGRIGED
jgi:hypothetical protein